MQDLTLNFIFICFALQITVWVAAAFSTKKVSENRSGWLMRIIAIIVVMSVLIFKKQIAVIVPFLDINLYPYSDVIGLVADVTVFSGMIIMIWARLILGKNWSANVVFKRDHELITRGPYAYVRHPIYSGLLLMILGVAIYVGNSSVFFLFILFLIGAYYKGHKEEELMIEHFSSTYIDYKKRVRSLIPFIL